MRHRLILSAALSAALAPPLFGQAAPAAAPPTTGPAIAQDGSDLSGIQLRALQAVLDARERRLDWHQAAQQAEDRVQGEELKNQLAQRLSGLAPRIVKALANNPQADALVDIQIYKQTGGDGKQAMVAVTFEGLDREIGGDFFAGVLADEVKPPEAEGIPQGLQLDPEASSYLVFFLGERGLQAGDIPQATMKRSILAALNHKRDVAAEQAQRTFEQQQIQQQRLAAEQRQIQAQQQAQAAQQASAAQSGTVPQDPNYGYPNTYPNVDDGYYYPGVGVPIVILPNGYANTPEWRQRERHREEMLEKRYANRRQQSPAGNANNVQNPSNENLPRPAGVVVPPGQAGVVVPPGSAGTRTPAGSQGTVTPPAGAGARTGAGQGNVQRQAPAPPPAGREAPAPAAHK